jgi:hypothetical protein
MQASLRCKRAITSRGSLDVDLTVDENLILKPSHHYLTKLCKNLPDVSTIRSTSNGPRGLLACLHLRLVCIAVIESLMISQIRMCVLKYWCYLE